MRKLVTRIIPVLCLLAAFPLAAQDAREIMQKNRDIPDGDSFRRSNVLLIVKSGKNEKKEFKTVSKEYGRKVRTRMKFTYPTDMRYLSWDAPGEENQQWIKLSSGKVRKIASSEKDSPWMNSHFYREDLSENYIEEYDYRLLGEETVDGVVCHKIESVKNTGQKVYSRRIIYIGKEDYLTYRVDFFENGRHTKTLTVSGYEKIDGIQTARKLIMERTDGKGKSILYTKSVDYNVSVDDRELT
ncbi:MAG: outer membrane lipoprotein-sorting protein, partial [Spirochaetota bacterium]